MKNKSFDDLVNMRIKSLHSLGHLTTARIMRRLLRHADRLEEENELLKKELHRAILNLETLNRLYHEVKAMSITNSL